LLLEEVDRDITRKFLDTKTNGNYGNVFKVLLTRVGLAAMQNTMDVDKLNETDLVSFPQYANCIFSVQV
jgi:hypothetical protein